MPGRAMLLQDEVLVRYGEISLKGANRPMFERILAQNLKSALKGVPGVRVEYARGRMRLLADAPTETWAPRAAQVFGVTSLSPAQRLEATPEALGAAGVDAV